MKLATLSLALLLGSPAFAAEPAKGTIGTVVPEKPNPDAIHVIYLHGKIIEAGGPRPIDTRFGVYEYGAILDALASRGAVVISEQRPAGTDVNAFAGHVVAQVEQLIRAGVDPTRIVVVGFSKGGEIAVRTSSFLRRPEVRYVLLGACWDRSADPQLRLTGRVLSIVERSDTLANASCDGFTRKPERPVEFKELRLDTGLSHGAFYRPLPAWTGPVLDYIDDTTKRR